MKSLCVGLFSSALGCVLAGQLQAADAPRTKAEILYSFGNGTDAAEPYAGLIDAKGTLYGTTIYGGSRFDGAVFALDPSTGAETVLYSFCSQHHCADGESPVAGLIDVKGTLYGTTSAGGAYGSGTVFSLDPGTGTETVIYSFCGQQNCADGEYPLASLINVKGTLYGTTQQGGGQGGGTVFALDPGTGTEAVVYSFCSQKGCADGQYPRASLINIEGTLYGTTYGGGTSGYYGTVFALDPDTDTETVLYSFCSQANCADGAFPYAGLVDVNGTLYGTTAFGGRFNGGTVFALDPGTGTETVLNLFCTQQKCTDGGYPEAPLADVKGTLYGTTTSGGNYGYGTAFALKTH